MLAHGSSSLFEFRVVAERFCPSNRPLQTFRSGYFMIETTSTLASPRSHEHTELGQHLSATVKTLVCTLLQHPVQDTLYIRPIGRPETGCRSYAE